MQHTVENCYKLVDDVVSTLEESAEADGVSYPKSYAKGYLQSLLGSIMVDHPEVFESLKRRFEDGFI